MANSIVIEIVANFKDNATAPAQALNAELDKLEKRKVNVGVTSDDKASRIIDDMNSKLDKQYPSAIVTEVDNSGYEWIDGTVWAQEQIAAGELERAIELGEADWKALRDASDQRKINAMLMLEIAKLKAGVNNE